MPDIHIQNPNWEYTIIPIKILLDKSISWEARAVLAYVIGHSNDECGVEIVNVVDSTKDGQDKNETVQRILTELEEAGYIKKLENSSGDRYFFFE